MKNTLEYLTYYSPSFIYIPFDTKEKLLLKKDKSIYFNMHLGQTNKGENIFSPVSGEIKAIQKVNLIKGASDSLVIENNFIEYKKKINPYRNILSMKKEEIKELLIKYNLYQKTTSKTILVVTSKYNKKYDLGDMVINYESYEEILETIDELLGIYNIQNAYIVIPREDFISRSAYNKYINAFHNICIVSSLKKLKNNKCTFYDVEDILSINKAIHLDSIKDTKMITINYQKKPIILKVKLYTLLSELFFSLNIDYKNKKIYVNDTLIDINNFIISNEVRSIKVI